MDIKRIIIKFKMLIKLDHTENKLTDLQYQYLLHEIDSENSDEYKYGVYMCYLIVCCV